MGYVEERMHSLKQYNPPTTKRPDHGQFWSETKQLYEKAARRLSIDRTEADVPISWTMRCWDLRYVSFDGTEVSGWYLLPAHRQPMGGVVVFPGYGAGRGYPEDHLRFAAAGLAVLAVDARGQGSQTGDATPYEHGIARGWITQGILSPYTSYYRRLLGDAFLAVECLVKQPEVRALPIAVSGASQGGGLALWSAILHNRPMACVAHIPNLCHTDRGILMSSGSLAEAADLIHRMPEYYDAVLATLSYFDLLNSIEQLSCPVLFTAGLKDTICSPETIYAVYNRARAAKEMALYPFDGHYVGGAQHRRSVEFIRRHMSGAVLSP